MLYQYLILLFWSFLAATFFPISSEIYLIAVIEQSNLVFIPVIVATIGNVAGGLVTFFMGWKGGELALKQMSDKNKKRFDKTNNIVQKYGPYSMVLAWVPFIGDFIVLIGGAFKLPPIQSIIWMTIGKFTRYLIFAMSVAGILENFFP